MKKKIWGAVLILAGAAILGAGVWGMNPLAGEKRFLILLQNQMELRPTGGFLGSYATARFVNGRLVELSVQDIYEPDGRVMEYIEPPEPIQEAFQLGTLRLRDANWEADFPTAAKTLLWYFGKAGEGEFDGMVATNLLVFQEILREIGPVKLADYDEVITSENLWEKTQFYSQEGFFPGSKQKREFLGDLAKAVREKIETAGWRQKLRLAKMGLKLLQEKQVMIYLMDERRERLLTAAGWAGEVKEDSLMVVEANLGVNKANCCLKREARLEVKRNEGGWNHKLTLAYENLSADSVWGGGYKAWVRVRDRGFWVEVPVGERREYEVEYSMPAVDNFLVQKQSGVDVWPLTVVLENNGEKQTRELMIRKDTVILLR